MTQVIGRTFGHYRVLQALDSGGMGSVYRARDEHLHKDVAVKLIRPDILHDPGARERFRREALVLARLSHPHIAVVYDYHQEDGTDFLAMELVPGGSLAARIAAGPLPPAEAAAIARDIASALAAAHEAGVIHRDLKPANVLFTQRGEVKVVDFGLAKDVASPEDRSTALPTLTATGTVAGTLPYMAPEQLMGAAVGAAADVWALGIVLHEMLSGSRPFQGDTGYALANAILNQPLPALPPDTPGPLAATVRACLARHPGERPTAAAVADALRSERTLPGHAIAVGPAAAAATATPQRPSSLARAWHSVRERPAWPAATLVALAIAAVVAVPRMTNWFHPASHIRSLAVVPLANLSGDPNQVFFADGMTEELITRLSQVAALKVIARTSVMKYRDTNKRARDIARELGVDGLIEGTVQRAGDQVRINAQLVSADEHNLWAGQYQRTLSNALTLQDDVARAIVGELRAHLTKRERTRLATAQPVDPKAYEAYLRGRYLWTHWTQGLSENRAAQQQFEQAVAIDPTFAAAWASLGDNYTVLSSGQMSPREAMPRARAAAERALQLDPGNAEAIAVRAYVTGFYDWNWREAEAQFHQALALDPNAASTHAQLGMLLSLNRRFDESNAEFAKARALDPLSSYVAQLALWPVFQSRHYDQLITDARRLLAADSSAWDARILLIQAYIQHRDFTAAMSEIHAQHPASADSDDAGVAIVHAFQGRRSEAQAILRRLQRRFEAPGQEPGWGQYLLGQIHASLGDRDGAIAALERSVAYRGEDLTFIYVDPLMDPLAADPRFQAILRKVGFGG